LTPALPRCKFPNRNFCFQVGAGLKRKFPYLLPIENHRYFLMPANILIVDDYADNRELLRLMLEGVGHRVCEAEDGRVGLEMAWSEMPDLILVDLSMPKVDGWEVLSQLRANEGTRHIPCVAVTAFADSVHARAVERGFDAYLSKPFRRLELIETVERMLSRQGGEAATSG
jgi:CheY-like chemotaxis protein